MELLLVKFHFISIIEPIIIPINLGSIVIQVVLLKFSFIEFLKVESHFKFITMLIIKIINPELIIQLVLLMLRFKVFLQVKLHFIIIILHFTVIFVIIMIIINLIIIKLILEIEGLMAEFLIR